MIIEVECFDKWPEKRALTALNYPKHRRVLAAHIVLDDNEPIESEIRMSKDDNKRDAPSATEAAKLLAQLIEARPGRHQKIAGVPLQPVVRLLREWQSARLARTHQDFLQDPRYRPATEFFLSDIYAARDFSQRNHDIQKAYDSMRKAVPERALQTLARTLELHEFTDDLDARLAATLVAHLGVTNTITPEQYAQGYRQCDNYDDRVRQIDMIIDIGRSVDRLVRLPFIGLTLRLAHVPANLAGWHELQDFLERGFAAFKHMNNADYFLNTVAHRERAILDRIYASHLEPFAIEANGRPDSPV
jgi:hypothetical protein